MPASIRIIKIVKDPVTHEDAYTVELEIEAEKAKELLSEITSCHMGKELIELLNKAQFLPPIDDKTVEELREEAKREEEETRIREEELKEEGRKEVRKKYVDFLKRKRGDVTPPAVVPVSDSDSMLDGASP